MVECVGEEESQTAARIKEHHFVQKSLTVASTGHSLRLLKDFRKVKDITSFVPSQVCTNRARSLAPKLI